MGLPRGFFPDSKMWWYGVQRVLTNQIPDKPKFPRCALLISRSYLTCSMRRLREHLSSSVEKPGCWKTAQVTIKATEMTKEFSVKIGIH